MAQINALTLADGQATPVSATFSVIQPQQGASPAKWMKRDGSSYAGYGEVTHLLSRKATSERVTIKVRLPYLNTDGSRRAQNMFTCQFILDDNATVEEKSDLLAFASNFLLTSTVANSVKNSEPTY